jgi:hypothetical protein
MRIEPPMSEPPASVAVPAASAAPEPPEEPPTPISGFHGLRVTPCRRVWVKPAHENSGVVARAWTIAPASRMRWASGDVSSATSSLKISEPCVHGCPAMAISSLTASGMPSSGRGSSPLPA